MRLMPDLRRFGLAGAKSVGFGVAAAGLFTYLFLSVTARVLGPVDFAPVSTLWALVFIVGPGLFLPLQQELGRLIAAARRERGGRLAVRRAVELSAVVAGVACIAGLVAGPWLTRELFSGNRSLLWCFEGSVIAYAAAFVVRGILSGLGDFLDFGRLIVYESASRFAIGGLLALSGARSPGAFGVAIAVAPALSTVMVTGLGRRIRLTPGREVARRELTRAFGWLLAGSLLAQLLANGGPVAVQLLATATEHAEAGRFLSALVIARVTLYLFQAAQATILPNLAELAAEHRHVELHDALRRLVTACSIVVAVATVGALMLGPLAVRILFGSRFSVGAETMAVLAGASAVYVLAAALSGVAIATAAHRLSAIAWLTGCACFAAGTLVGDDVFRRVETGYLIGSCVTAAVLVLRLPASIRAHEAAQRIAIGDGKNHPPSA